MGYIISFACFTVHIYLYSVNPLHSLFEIRLVVILLIYTTFLLHYTCVIPRGTWKVVDLSGAR